MSKPTDETIEVTAVEDGVPVSFMWRGQPHAVKEVIGRWRIEGRWWADGREREYWRVETHGNGVWDLYHDRTSGRWHLERLWD